MNSLCEIPQKTMQQKAFELLFNDGQNIAFQNRVDEPRPYITKAPLEEELEYSFFCPNPLEENVEKRSAKM